jgi:hypothetical protein
MGLPPMRADFTVYYVPWGGSWNPRPLNLVIRLGYRSPPGVGPYTGWLYVPTIGRGCIIPHVFGSLGIEGLRCYKI